MFGASAGNSNRRSPPVFVNRHSRWTFNQNGRQIMAIALPNKPVSRVVETDGTARGNGGTRPAVPGTAGEQMSDVPPSRS